MYRLSTLHNDLNPEILSKNHEAVFKFAAPRTEQSELLGIAMSSWHGVGCGYGNPKTPNTDARNDSKKPVYSTINHAPKKHVAPQR